MKLILASSSPRRKQLLEDAGYRFSVHPADESIEATANSIADARQLVKRLAALKAENVAIRTTEDALIVAADTVAECQGAVLGKPADRQQAREMLLLMRGQLHCVHTGVCLWKVPGDKHHLAVETTRLRMDPLSDEQIDAYLDRGEWKGKAGAFGYQDGLDWVHIEQGSESNVVGLPMERLQTLLKGFC